MADPAEFDDDEQLIRALKTPQFVKNGVIKPAAFKPGVNRDRLSIVRWAYRPKPESTLKAQFQLMAPPNDDPKKNSYCGVGSFKAAACRLSEISLEAADEEFEGHAHIVFPFAILPNDPLEGEAFVLTNKIAEALKAKVLYVPDPDPISPEWTIRHPTLPLEE